MIDDMSCKIELLWKITLKFVNCFAKVAKVASGDSLAPASAAASVVESSNTLPFPVIAIFILGCASPYLADAYRAVCSSKVSCRTSKTNTSILTTPPPPVLANTSSPNNMG